MVAYIIGMITGAVCLVSPLCYLMNVDRCLATIWAQNPTFPAEQFKSQLPSGLLYVIAVIGAVVLVLSALMMAYAGLTEIRQSRKGLPESAKPEAAEEPPLPSL